jgi:hypothetical protein
MGFRGAYFAVGVQRGHVFSEEYWAAAVLLAMATGWRGTPMSGTPAAAEVDEANDR